MKTSLKMIGLGQGGTRISQVFEKAGVDCAYANFDHIDFSGLNIPDSKKIIISGTGTGASFKKGLMLVEKNKDIFSKFLDEHLSRDHINMFVFSLSGGSGSSMGVTALKYALSNKYKTGVLTVLPPKIQGMLAMDNAMRVLEHLKEQDIKTFILADNEYILGHVGVKKDWWSGVNEYIFSAVASMFDIIREGKTSSSGIGSIDKGELMRIIQFGNGMLDPRVLYLNQNEIKNINDEDLHNFLYAPMLMEGYKYKETLAFIINIDTPVYENYSAFIQRILESVKSNLGGTIAKIGMFVDPTLTDSIRITIINAALKLPKNINKDIRFVNRDARKYSTKKEKEDMTDFSMLESSIDEDFEL